jgi:hypothetical protein
LENEHAAIERRATTKAAPTMRQLRELETVFLMEGITNSKSSLPPVVGINER